MNNTLTEKIINKINELNALIEEAEKNPAVVADLMTLKVTKPYQSKKRRVSIKGALNSVVKHIKDITSAPESEKLIAEESVAEEPIVEESVSVQTTLEAEVQKPKKAQKKSAKCIEVSRGYWGVIDEETGERIDHQTCTSEDKAYRQFKASIIGHGYVCHMSEGGKEANKRFYKNKYYKREYGYSYDEYEDRKIEAEEAEEEESFRIFIEKKEKQEQEAFINKYAEQNSKDNDDVMPF